MIVASSTDNNNNNNNSLIPLSTLRQLNILNVMSINQYSASYSVLVRACVRAFKAVTSISFKIGNLLLLPFSPAKGQTKLNFKSI